jgi:RNA polymerase sigma-70 factor (ECF subfamily)
MATGHRLVFEDVYAELHPRIRRYLDRLLGAGEADDATQEVFLKASRALPRFRGDSSLSTWVYRIATNLAHDRLRSPSFRRAAEVAIDSEAAVKDPSVGVERQMARREMSACVDRFIDRLPANYRSVVILSEQEDLTNQEIAEALHLTVDTVKIRLHRARARLKKELGEGCNFYRDEQNELACDPKPNVALFRRRPSTNSTSR